MCLHLYLKMHLLFENKCITSCTKTNLIVTADINIVIHVAVNREAFTYLFNGKGRPTLIHCYIKTYHDGTLAPLLSSERSGFCCIYEHEYHSVIKFVNYG